MAEGEVRQYFVRNDKGTLWGPLALATIELLVENGSIQGRIQVSEDGINFAFPGRFPHIRGAFPRELWGDVIAPGPTTPVAAPMAGPPGATAPHGSPAPAGVPVAGPGVAAARAGAPPMAGPGARPGAPPPGAAARPVAPGPHPQAARPPPGAPGAPPQAARPPPGAPPQAARPPPGAPGAPPQAARPPPGAPGAPPQAVRPPPGAPGAPPQAARPPPGAPPQAPRPPPGAPPGAAARPVAPGAPPQAARPPPGAPPGATARPVAPGAPGPHPQAPRPPPGAPPGAAARPVTPGAPGPQAQAPRPPPTAPGAPPPQAARPPPGTPPGAAASPVAPSTAPQQPAPAPQQPAPVARPAAPSTPPSPSPAPAPAAASTPADAPPPSGQLETHSPVRLYGLLAAGSHTGLLTLTLAGCTVSVHFRKGNPEFIDSSSPEDALGTSLMQARLVTAEQLRQAEAARERFGGELLGALFGLGLLQPATAFTQLGQRAQSILLKGLSAEAGSFTYEPKELPPHKAMPLGNKWAVLTDLSRRLPLAELRRRLQPVVDLPVMKSGGLVATSDLRLTPHEVRALSVIDGVRSLGQLLTALPQDAEHLVRLVFLLKELDAVSFAAVPQRATPPPPQPQAAAPQAGPPPSSPPPAAASKPAAPAAAPAPAPAASKPAAPAAAPAPAPVPSADEIPALRELAAKLKEQNHFERLGLGADCNGPAVKIAYFKLAKQYHPDTLPPGTPPELEKLKADVFAYIGEAYRTLSDDKSRAAYIEELKHGGGDGQEVDVEAILKAEELFRKSGLYIKARKFSDAVAMLDEAIQLNPEEPEFYAWRGYARFYTYPDKRTGQAEAFRDLNLCLKKNDKVVAAHYYLGVIAKACGDHSGALKHFQKTVELQPNHIEAQREIRLATQRK